MDFNFSKLWNIFLFRKNADLTKASEPSIKYIPEANPSVQINLLLYREEKKLPPSIAAEHVIAEIISHVQDGESRFEIICGKNKQAKDDANRLASDSARRTIEGRTGVPVTNVEIYIDKNDRLSVVINVEHPSP